jgi:DsbC/DsbD-like thiol-disulfide interchange protein
MERLTRAALVAAVALAAAGDAHAQKKSDAVVKTSVAYDDKAVDGKQVVTITLDIEKGWHLYANPVGNADLTDSQTTVAINAKGKPADAKVEFPAGKEVVDKVVGNYKVYEGKVTINATVTRAKGDTGPLEVVLKFQACNEKQCLLPATVKVAAGSP